MQKQLILLYHFFHPDEVISARLFSDLAVRMSSEGWNVVAMPAARMYDGDRVLATRERYGDVDIHRIWRPSFKQASNLGRLVNACAMLIAWTWRALVTRRYSSEVMIVGTDPILSILIAVPWRLLRPKCRIIHWCHDVHPEASIAEGTLTERSWIVRALRALLTLAYRRCDRIVDLGDCMRQLLFRYQPNKVYDTITPWALVEPDSVSRPSDEIHKELFGTKSLGCLYSGNLGRAHDFELFVKLARQSRPLDIGFCFAGRGAKLRPLKDSLTTADTNIRIAGFADESQLHARLQAGDIHLVSLQDNWTGTVVPSKFFGALAIGRPILFVGSHQCALADWIKNYGLGWHLTEENLESIALDLNAFARDPSRRLAINQHCQQVYQSHFSRMKQLQRWSEVISELGK